MLKMKKLVAGVKGAAARAAVGVVAAGSSVAAFAQSTGTGSTFDTTGIVSAVSGTTASVVAVGTAVLGVVAVAWGIKMVRSFLGR